MPRYFIKLSYDGSRFNGWQIQPNAPSVQEAISQGLTLITGREVNLVGCGRTDTGVHAREYFAHFDLGSNMGEADLIHLTFRLNRYLPESIAVHWVREVEPEMHARFSAVSRTYHYYIHTVKDPFLSNSSWFVHDIRNVAIMNEGASILMAYEDFTSFSKLHSAAKTNICHISEAKWEQEGHRLVFRITADRFLRNMVRAIVGTLVEMGQGKMPVGRLHEIIEAKNRSDAGQSVPAHGLFLEKIVYPVTFGD